MRFTTKMVLINVIVIMAAIAITGRFTFDSMATELNRQATVAQENILKTYWELLHAKGEGFDVVNGKLQVGEYSLDGDSELADKIMHLFGGTAAVFQGDTRISLNVLNADGSSAIVDKLPAAAHEAVYVRGIAFRGETSVLGVPYFIACDPITDGRGDIVGALYVGVKKSDYFASYGRTRSIVLMMSALLAVACSIFYWLIIRRLTNPMLDRLSRMSDNIHSHAEAIDKNLDHQAGFATQLSKAVVEISTAMEELSMTAGKIAQHSRKVVAQTDRNLEETRHGVEWTP